jgi:hypothetical protein
MLNEAARVFVTVCEPEMLHYFSWASFALEEFQ